MGDGGGVIRAQNIVGYSPGRPKDDFYPTPEHVTQSLLDVELFDGAIWECACGDGAISNVLDDNGYKVYSTDLNNHGFGWHGVNFLKTGQWFAPNIVTNPPFKLAQEFMEHALELGVEKLALFCKLAFLEGQRRSVALEASPLKNIYVFRKRVLLTWRGEKPRGSGMIAFAWYVWERGYKGKPMVNWI